MNDVKIKPIVGWNFLFGASLLVILALVWYGFLRPQETGTSSTWKRTLDGVNATTRKANDAAESGLGSIDARTWETNIDALGSQVLGRLTQVASKHNLQLSNFRTERPTALANLTEAPFVVVVDGDFPDVIAFMQSVEAPGNRLALNLLQVSSSDAAPGKVTATMGLVGFRKEGI